MPATRGLAVRPHRPGRACRVAARLRDAARRPATARTLPAGGDPSLQEAP
jgi:hypothetical protein